MSGAVIGRDRNLGQNCFVAIAVAAGRPRKIQNNVSPHAGTVVEDEVFRPVVRAHQRRPTRAPR
ncbi:MAG: hypothetical protein IPH72_15975 [Sandaracinaceae bacterium]|nr:hypothetical protein [Sandaracinaceae bacterium]